MKVATLTYLNSLDSKFSAESVLVPEPDGEEAKTSVLCVSNLPRNVTEVSVTLKQ